MATRVRRLDVGDLESYLDSKRKVDEIKAALKAAERSLEITESSLIAALKGGAKVPTAYVAFVEEKIMPVRPRWKDAFVGLAERQGLNAAAEVEAVVSSTEPNVKDVLHVHLK